MITIPALCSLHPNSNLLPPLHDPMLDLSQDQPCHSCRICREQWMNPGQTNPPPPEFLFPVAFGAVFPQENQELSSQVDSDPWMGTTVLGECPQLLVTEQGTRSRLWIQRLWPSSNRTIPFVLPGKIPTRIWGFFSLSRHPSSDSSSPKSWRDDPGYPTDPDPCSRSRVWDQPRNDGNMLWQTDPAGP